MRDFWTVVSVRLMVGTVSHFKVGLDSPGSGGDWWGTTVQDHQGWRVVSVHWSSFPASGCRKDGRQCAGRLLSTALETAERQDG